jgi:hypothetical protein
MILLGELSLRHLVDLQRYLLVPLWNDLQPLIHKAESREVQLFAMALKNLGE